VNIKVSGSLLTQGDFKTVHKFKGDKTLLKGLK
jgi:hypothetical protein